MASKLTKWINKKLKDKGTTAAAEKKKAGKYKSISAAKKGGSLYYTDKNGKVMIAAFAEDLNSVSDVQPIPKQTKITREELLPGSDKTLKEVLDAPTTEAGRAAAASKRRDAKTKASLNKPGNEAAKKADEKYGTLSAIEAAKKRAENKRKANMYGGGMAKKKGYNKGGLKTAPNKGAASLPKGVRNSMGFMNAGGMAKKKVMTYNLGGMVKSQTNHMKKGR